MFLKKLFCPFKGNSQHFLRPCAMLKSKIKMYNFGIGVLKQFRTTCRVPNFFLQKLLHPNLLYITPPPPSNPNKWKSLVGKQSWRQQIDTNGPKLFLYSGTPAFISSPPGSNQLQFQHTVLYSVNIYLILFFIISEQWLPELFFRILSQIFKLEGMSSRGGGRLKKSTSALTIFTWVHFSLQPMVKLL